MTQVPMTLTKGQGHRSRSNVQKLAKIYKMGHNSDAISPTDFILGTKVQPNKAHSMTQVPMILTKGQGQIFPKMRKKPKNWSYLGGYFIYRLNKYLVQRYNLLRHFQ